VLNGAWHHGVVTYDSSTGAWAEYVNGVLKASGTVASGQQIFTTSKILTIGIGNYNNIITGQYPFNGAIDDVRVYNQAYTISQVQKDYAEGLARHQVAKK